MNFGFAKFMKFYIEFSFTCISYLDIFYMYVRCELKVKDKFIYKLNRNYNTCFYVKKIVQIVQLGKLALREN